MTGLLADSRACLDRCRQAAMAVTDRWSQTFALRHRCTFLLLFGGLYFVAKTVYDPFDALPPSNWETASKDSQVGQCAVSMGVADGLASMQTPFGWRKFASGMMELTTLNKATRFYGLVMVVHCTALAVVTWCLMDDNILIDFAVDRNEEENRVTASTGDDEADSRWIDYAFADKIASKTFPLAVFVTGVYIAIALCRHVFPSPFKSEAVSILFMDGAIWMSIGCLIHGVMWCVLHAALHLLLLPMILSQIILVMQHIIAVFVAEACAILQGLLNMVVT